MIKTDKQKLAERIARERKRSNEAVLRNYRIPVPPAVLVVQVVPVSKGKLLSLHPHKGESNGTDSDTGPNLPDGVLPPDAPSLD